MDGMIDEENWNVLEEIYNEEKKPIRWNRAVSKISVAGKVILVDDSLAFPIQNTIDLKSLEQIKEGETRTDAYILYVKTSIYYKNGPIFQLTDRGMDFRLSRGIRIKKPIENDIIDYARNKIIKKMI